MICEADGRTRFNRGGDWTAAKWHFEIRHRQPPLAAVSRQLSGSNGGEHSQVTARTASGQRSRSCAQIRWHSGLASRFSKPDPSAVVSSAWTITPTSGSSRSSSNAHASVIIRLAISSTRSSLGRRNRSCEPQRSTIFLCGKTTLTPQWYSVDAHGISRSKRGVFANPSSHHQELPHVGR